MYGVNYEAAVQAAVISHLMPHDSTLVALKLASASLVHENMPQ